MSTSACQSGGGGEGPSQEEVDDILGAALDALDDLDEDKEDQSADIHVGASAATAVPAPAEEAQQQAPKKVYYGPEPPPPGRSPSKPAAAASSSSSPSASLEDAMSQLMKAGDALQGGDDIGSIDLDGAEKILDELMDHLQLGGLSEVDGAADGKRSTTNSKQHSSDGQSKNEKEKDGDGTKGTKTSSDNNNIQSAHSTPASRANTSTGTDADADVDRAVKRLLSDMAKASSDDIPNMDEINGSQMEAVGEEMMESMMKELSAFGSSGDADDVVDGMMKQLLSKDLMYDPMKQVCDRFPAWLAESKAHLSEEEYQKYGTQYQYFQRIVHVYETDPENFARLMELMQDIQEYGQPPADIIKELAPGLEFDEEGMPKMDGQGMGMPGMPLFAPGDEQCTLM